jgi:hypothetical protein
MYTYLAHCMTSLYVGPNNVFYINNLELRNEDVSNQTITAQNSG